jgi:hypothetical protein
MKRTQIKTAYYWFMTCAGVLLGGKLLYLISSSDKESIFIILLVIAVLWLAALTYTQVNLQRRPNDPDLENQFTIFPLTTCSPQSSPMYFLF